MEKDGFSTFKVYYFFSFLKIKSSNYILIAPVVRRPVRFLSINDYRPWQREIYEEIHDPSVPADPRKVFWIWDTKGGSGKSTFAKSLLGLFENRAIIVHGKADDIYNRILRFSIPDPKKGPVRDWPDIILWDIPKCKSDHFQGGALETLKNGCISVNKYEGGQILMNAPHILVFANFPPPRPDFTEERFFEYDLRTEEEKQQAAITREPDVIGQAWSNNFQRRRISFHIRT